jgi:hypothetical protein
LYNGRSPSDAEKGPNRESDKSSMAVIKDGQGLIVNCQLSMRLVCTQCEQFTIQSGDFITLSRNGYGLLTQLE